MPTVAARATARRNLHAAAPLSITAVKLGSSAQGTWALLFARLCQVTVLSLATGLWAVTGLASNAWAQPPAGLPGPPPNAEAAASQPAAADGAAAGNAAAEGAKPKGQMRYAVHPAGQGGLYLYVPGQWAMVNIDLGNSTDRDAEITCATFFESEKSLQYGRKVWVPPGAKLKVSHPILVPRQADDENPQFTLSWQSVVEESGKLVREDTSKVTHTGSFKLTTTRPNTGMIQDQIFERPDAKNPQYDLLVACRVRGGYGRQVASLQDQFLPPDEESYRALDQLVLGSSRVLDDQAGLAAIRQWVGGGGKLWIMFDSLDPEVLSAFFGDAWQGTVVDRVGLTRVQLTPGPRQGGEPTEPVEYDTPISLARVVLHDEEPVYLVNGWPAAFWKTYGAGRVLVTTLAPQGWMNLNPSSQAAAENLVKANAEAAAWTPPPGGVKAPPPTGMALRPQVDPNAPPPPPAAPAGPGDRARNQAAYQQAMRSINETSLYVPNEAMLRLQEEFFTALPFEKEAATLLAEQAGEYIGYQVPGRLTILGWLGGFAGALALLAVLLWRSERLELLGWAVPVLGALVALALIGLGRSNRQSSPSAVSVVQRVRVVPGASDYHLDGAMAAYSPEGTERTLGQSLGGRLMPDMSGLGGEVRRMEWTDLGKWQWKNLVLPPGQRTVALSRSGTSKIPFVAEATFNEQGLAGRLSAGDGGPLSDVILATAEGRLGVTLEPDGRFVANADNVLGANQYLSANMLSDEQNRRQNTVRRVLDSIDKATRQRSVQVLGWTAPWLDGLELDEGRKREGAALIQMPLQISRPPAGTTFLVPGPLLPFRNLRGVGPDGLTSSPIWEFTRNTGADRSQPGTAWFQFTAPEGLTPFEALGATIRMDVSGPIGRVELAGWNGTEVKVLKEWIDPVGRLEFELTDPALLPVSEGSVLLRFSAGDPTRPELTLIKGETGDLKTTWRINTLSVDLKARTLERESP